MRALAAVLIALAFAACTPEIQGGSYYCGVEAQCPEGLACDGATHTCVPPIDVVPFACSEGAAMPTPSCPPDTLGTHGCVMTAAAHDQVVLHAPAGCASKMSAQLTFPLSFMTLTATVRDSGGTAIATSAPCHSEHGGLVEACVDFAAEAGQTYTFDVAASDGAPTCGGACAFNEFDLAVQVLRP
jgi:hypothetical protein